MNELRRLLSLFRPYRGWMALGAFLSLLTLIANIGLMALSGWFIAAMALAGLAGVSMNYFTPAGAIRGFAIARTVGRYGERLLTHEATLRLLAGLRVWFYEHLEPLAPARLQQYRSGDLLSRIRGDIDTLDNFYQRILVPTVVALLITVLAFVFLAWFSLAVAVTTTALLLLAGGVLPWWLRRLGQRPGERQVQASAELRAGVIDGVQGLAELQVYGAAERQAAHIAELNADLVASQSRLSALDGVAGGAIGFLTHLAMWLAIIFGAQALAADQLTGPQLAMLTFFALAVFEAVMPLPTAFQRLGETIAAARRVFEIVDAEPQVTPPAQASPSPQHYDIEFQRVYFRYDDSNAWALAGIDLELPTGGSLAVVGATGSGKTSVVNLLLRFWEYQAGYIHFGGHDLRRYHSEDLRRYIAVVSQHAHLFNTTIRNNLLLARPEASQAELEQAAAAAQILEFINAQPAGWETYVGESGVRLSGGQARRVAIARALLKDAPVLLLDEPTEGLDAPTERALMADIGRLTKARTVLLITHRLVGLQAFEQIVVLDHGQIVEHGHHTELLTRGGVYAGMLARLGDDAMEAPFA